MKAKFYRIIRDLHLYLGLFISPFVILFSVTVFFFVHSGVPKLTAESANTRTVSGVSLPPGLEKLSNRPLVDLLKPILKQLNVPGEIGFVSNLVKDEKMIIPVSIPGRVTTVTINLA
ncbi:MAG: hypothetical protein JWM99_2223, partial [Verrucomicrobiales bacterium]|nr:hypothetical protein [Verrucomicrobiales bacterium]